MRKLRFAGDERALIDGIAAGQAAAAAELYDRYVVDIRRILVRLVGPTNELSDLVQDAYVAALQSVGSVRDPSALRPWMLRVAINTARRHLRSRRRRRWLLLGRDDGDEATALAHVAPSQRSSLALGEAWRILDRMGVEDRIVFSLRFIEGMELGEMAAELDLSVSTVKRRLARATTRFEAAARHTRCLKDWRPGGTE